MKHRQFKEWLQLSAIGELTRERQELLDVHLRECSECRTELASIKSLASVVAGHRPVEVTEDLLGEARQQLRVALLELRLKRSPFEQVLDNVRDIATREYRVVFGGLAMSALGVFVGYMIFTPSHVLEAKQENVGQPFVQQAVQKASANESFTQGDTRTSNIHLIDTDGGDGTIEFTFDAVTPMHVRGNVNDEKVQKVLARALVSEENPGVRLRTMNAIASQSQEQQLLDPHVKAALLSALKGDQNPGVRQEALRVLLRYAFDSEIREGLVYTLTHDKNSGMRIAAINGLAAASVDGHHMDQDILEILKHKIQSDNNTYVRRQARTVVEEVTHR